MILIGEAGASKTGWRIVDRSTVTSISSPAFNASRDAPQSLFQSLPEAILNAKPTKVYFYAAGLLAHAKEELLSAFQQHFVGAAISLEPDTLAAARALFGKEAGNVGILGTGAAACYFDGKKIANRVPSLGYVLGDEGSGFDLGRRLLVHAVRNQLPDHLAKAFYAQFPDILESQVIQRVYKSEGAAAWVASHVPFLAAHLHEPFIHQLVKSAFYDYLKAFGAVSESPVWGFCGSVAYHFSPVLQSLFHERGLILSSIISSPIENLSRYHQTYG